MALRFFDNGKFTYASDSVQIDFADATSIQVEITTTFEGSLDPRSNRISVTRSGNITEPNTITFQLGAQCATDDGSNIIDILSELDRRNKEQGFAEKGVLRIVDDENGKIITFPDAILTKDPLFGDRTIERGSGTSTYTVIFIAANPVKKDG